MSDHFGNIPIEPPESSPPDKKPQKQIPQETVPAKPKSRRSTVKLSKTKRLKTKRSSPKRSSAMTIWGWIAAAAVFGVALYCLVGFLGVPYYVTKIFPDHFQERTGMMLKPATVTFNPFTFRFEAEDMRVLSESGAPIMSVNSLLADVAPSSFLRMDLICNTVTINELDLKITREMDGSYNFQQIFGAKKESTPSEILNISDLPFSFSLNNISISNSKIVFNDGPAGKIHTVENIKLDLPIFSNIPLRKDQHLRPHFSAIVNGSPVELTGQASIGESDDEDQTTRLSMEIHDLNLTLYSGYLPFSLPMEFKKGIANGKIDLSFDPLNTSGDKLSIEFQLQLSGAELTKESESLSIAAPAAQLKGKLQPVSKTIHFTDIAVKEPMVSSFGKSLLRNIKAPPKKAAQETPPDSPDSPASSGSAEAAPYHLIIDQLLVDNGTMLLFSEKTNKQPTSTWNAIQLNIKDYRSAAGNGKNQDRGIFRLSGEKDGTSSDFSWKGSFSSTESVTGNLIIQKMDSNELFKIIGSDHPFKLKGIVDLKGQLTFSSNNEQSSPLTYKMHDAELIIENFSLIDKIDKEKEEIILTAPVVKFTGMSYSENKSIDFGNVQFKKAAAHFTYGRIPKFFKEFEAHKYRIKGIDFAGETTFNSSKKSGGDLVFTNVSLKANELGSSKEAPNNLTVSAQTASSGVFNAQGSVALAPFSVNVKTGFRELPAGDVLPFFTTSSLLAEINGTLSGKGQITLPSKSYEGELQLIDFSHKKAKGKTLSWQKAVFKDIKYTAKPFHFGLTSAVIDQAHYFWTITANDNEPMDHLASFFQKYWPSANQPSPGKSKTGDTAGIKEISFTNGKIQIEDQRLTPRWEGEIVAFAGKIQDVQSSTSSESVFSFTGQLDDTPFTIDGAVDLFTEKNNGSFQFSLENYPIASFHEQLTPKTDINTSNGEFRATIDYTWLNEQFVRAGNFVFYDVSPVDATAESALPLALLKGDDNTFSLPIEFSSTEPAAQVALFDEVLTSFQRQVLKGSVSPLLLAKGDFTDLIGNDIIEFEPGEFMLTEKGREMLLRYGTLLKNHPHIGLELSDGIDPKIDRQAMNQQLTAIEQQRIENQNQKLFREWQEKKDNYESNLEKQRKKSDAGEKIMEQDIPTEILTGFTPIRPEPVVVSDEMVLELRQKRINILNDYFTNQLALQPERIVIENEDQSGEPENSASGLSPGVSITLKAINQ
jgi:hypothetical protein